MRLPVILRPEAEEDIEGAFEYLEEVRVGLGQRFVQRSAKLFSDLN